MRKMAVLFCYLLLTGTCVFAVNKVEIPDSTVYVLMNFFVKADEGSLLSNYPSVDEYCLLKSNGFSSNIIFVMAKKFGRIQEIKENADGTKTSRLIYVTDFFNIPIRDSSGFYDNKLDDQCVYILAYNIKSGRYYRLKGFRQNDYNNFKNDERIRNVRKREVEHLNLVCLQKCYGRRWFRKERAPCMRSCYWRDQRSPLHMIDVR